MTIRTFTAAGPRRPAASSGGRAGRGLRLLRCLLLCSLLYLLGGVPGGAARAAEVELTEVELTPAAGSPELELEIGDDLWIRASGLEGNQAVDAVLTDDAGRVLRRLELRTRRDGSLTPDLLWFRTGVVGCDRCRLPEELLPLEFLRFEEAEQALRGRTFSLRLEVPGKGRVLSRRRLRLISPRGARYYFSDAGGCPRYRLELGEEVYLAAFGGGGEPLRVFLAAGRPSWLTSGRLFHEIRGLAEGLLLSPRAGAPELLATAASLPPGTYAGILREDVADTRQQLTGKEILLIELDDIEPGPTTDDGLVINDWGSCGGPGGPLAP